MSENNKGMDKLFLDGIWGENPLFRLALGVCPAVAVTTTGINGLAIGLATAAGIFKSVIAIILLTGANFISKRLGEDSLL